MENTKLIKRYEKETGKIARDELYSGSIKLYMPTNEYIAWLEDQLRWRLVSDELPSVEKYGDAIMGRNKDVDEGLVQVDCISTIWFLDNYERWFTHWLPIPPTPEGEKE